MNAVNTVWEADFFKGQHQGEMTQLPGSMNSFLESSMEKVQATVPCKY